MHGCDTDEEEMAPQIYAAIQDPIEEMASQSTSCTSHKVSMTVTYIFFSLAKPQYKSSLRGHLQGQHSGSNW